MSKLLDCCLIANTNDTYPFLPNDLILYNYSVTDIDIESEKKFESLLAKEEEGISFNDEILLSLKALHLELALLKSTNEEMSKKLEQLP